MNISSYMIIKGWSGAWPFSVRIVKSLVNSVKRARPQLHKKEKTDEN